MFQYKTFLFVIIFINFLFVSQATAQEAQLPAPKVYKVRAKLTSYCTCSICCEKWSGGKKTATGTDARKPNGVAAAPQLVPFGSRVFIPGLKTNPIRNVDDTGGGMRKMARQGIVQFDIRARTHAEALRFGKRFQDVYVILDEPSPDQCAFFDQNALSWWTFDYDESISSVFEQVVAQADAKKNMENVAPELVSVTR